MSAFPNKYVPVEHSMVGLAAYLIDALNYNDTVSSLWDRVRQDDRVRTFDRFARALTILFAGGLVRLDQGVLRRDVASETDS